MQKLFFYLLTTLIIFASTSLGLAATPDYRVTVSNDHKKVHVDGAFNLQTDIISMYVTPTAKLPDGQATFVQNLVIKDAQGQSLQFGSKGEGDWQIAANPQPITISYDIALEHSKYEWPAGIDEIAYTTDEGIFFTGTSLFIVPGLSNDPVTVSFQLPAGWQAATPWAATSNSEPRYQTTSFRELIVNCLFLGTISQELIKLEQFELRLAIGKPYLAARELFLDTLRTALASYIKMFGSAPPTARYLIVINAGNMNDGGAFSNSFSQFINGKANDTSRLIWGHGMAHELLHYWNGITLKPVDDQEEWLKEGFTDYYTIVHMSRNNLIDRANRIKKLETITRRYFLARLLQPQPISLRAAGKEKAQNRLLIYGGGAIVALALDVQIRNATSNKHSLDDVMRQLYQEFGTNNKRYTITDLIRLTRAATGYDMTDFANKYVDGSDYLQIEPYLNLIGLQIDSFVEEIYISNDTAASDKARNLEKAIFGN